ncbi:YVTN repeat-like/Quino protein amine dehydrogenase [Karstenula rhodostoma CBS 690.94]|uniref:YVTN repeat-like/Quino protein amine dehydrogenase n=1 Tax=Karstenula rhodostoma CBS 690.94 TaxID=1392251 RepID=A0A9P4P8T7_9PLEO|nr:YVTN repeat-like/Quino protein amine dehydrogenase [Karstenula rhodostoma CBS 690.94]
MATRSHTQKDFLLGYEFPLHPLQDFALNGTLASHAPEHPKEWGQEKDGFDFWKDFEQHFGSKSPKGDGESVHRSIAAAVSPDSKLLAISSAYPREGILIYDVVTKELRQVLEGCGTLAFKPPAAKYNVETEGQAATADAGGKPAYTLISNISTSEPRPQPYTGLILWELDHNGRLFVEEEPIDPAAIATKAIEAIVPELESEHEWTRAFVDASSLHADFVRALEKTSVDHRRRNNTVIQDAQIPSFVQSPFSCDGHSMVYVTNNRTTQHGMRDPEDLPHVVVYDVDAGREVHHFSGHTDMVAWFGFSPDGRHVASVSWDGTLRMSSIETRGVEWATESSGGQSWSGAFSPDSKHVIWSSRSGKEIKVHEVADGKVLSIFPETVANWCRYFSWHPTEPQVALCADKTVYVWRPFDGPEGVVVQRMVIDGGDRFPRMAQIQNASWMEDGRLLALGISDRTTLVYDTLTNAKEVFKRQRGVDAAHIRSGFFELPKGEEGKSAYLSVDGDGKVRYWDRSVAPLPDAQSERESPVEASWSESRSEQGRETPKNGKYVAVWSKIREQIGGTRKGKETSDQEREAWAQQGTSIWTAE